MNIKNIFYLLLFSLTVNAQTLQYNDYTKQLDNTSGGGYIYNPFTQQYDLGAYGSAPVWNAFTNSFDYVGTTGVNIISNPSSVVINEGINTSFTVTATGTIVSYKWQTSSNNILFSDLSNAGIYSNVTTKTVTLTKPSTVVNNKYYRCIVIGSGSVDTSNSAFLTVYDTAAYTYYAAMTTQWDSVSKQKINNFVISQIDSGLWAKKSRIFLIASTSAGDCVIDLKGTENASLVNSPTFTQYRGFTSATGKYMNSNFNPVTNGETIYTLNNCRMAIYSNTNLQSMSNDIGHSDSANVNQMIIRNTSDLFRPNTPYRGVSLGSKANTNSIGLFELQRSASNAYSYFINGENKTSSTTASVALVNNNIFIGTTNNNGSPSGNSTRQYSYSEFGSSLSDAEIAKNYSQIKTLLTYILSK
jgi:hypothetical protein